MFSHQYIKRTRSRMHGDKWHGCNTTSGHWEKTQPLPWNYKNNTFYFISSLNVEAWSWVHSQVVTLWLYLRVLISHWSSVTLQLQSLQVWWYYLLAQFQNFQVQMYKHEFKVKKNKTNFPIKGAICVSFQGSKLNLMLMDPTSFHP